MLFFLLLIYASSQFDDLVIHENAPYRKMWSIFRYGLHPNVVTWK